MMKENLVLMIMVMQLYCRCHTHQSMIQIVINDNENEMENPDAAKSSAEYRTDLVVKLIDKKPKHIERKLSAAQRDEILLEEAREDRMFRRDLAESLKSST